MAIDRDADHEVGLQGHRRGRPAPSSRRSSPGYRENTCGEACKYNPAEAKALLPGRWRPVDAAASPTTRDGGHKDWVDATCNQLKTNLGVDCVGQAEPKFADLLTKVETADPGVGMFRLGWVMDYPSMEDYLRPAVQHRAARRTTTATATRSSTSWSDKGTAATTQAGGDQELPAGRGHPRQGPAGDPAALRAEQLRSLDQGSRTSRSTCSTGSTCQDRVDS